MLRAGRADAFARTVIPGTPPRRRFAGYLTEGGLTRGSRDTAGMPDAIAGPAIGVPYVAPSPDRPLVQEAGADPGHPLIGFFTWSPLVDPLDPERRMAVEKALVLCEACRHDVTKAMPGLDTMKLRSNLFAVIAAGAGWDLSDRSRRLGRPPEQDAFEPCTWTLPERGRNLSAADCLLAVQDTRVQVRQYSRFLDMWLTPNIWQ